MRRTKVVLRCVLCRSPYRETDVHCPGGQCGADLDAQRSRNSAYAVQAWCEPREVTARPGETVLVKLTLRNAGSALDRYEPQPAADAKLRTAVDRTGPPDVFPGEKRVWYIMHRVARDDYDTMAPNDGDTPVSGLEGTNSRDGDTVGEPTEDPTRPVPTEIDVSIRVVSTRDPWTAAGARFTIRVAPTHRGEGLASAPHPESVDPHANDRGGGGYRRLRTTGAAVVALVVRSVRPRS
ncbi:hypothetical protein OG948_34545 (plasmid) [Embleya sp. NBC_00888]|uniref:hypothetical protein n=1 Tax=Embleya sp. NBC_00888 TaxID=2975960 RepID=UPI002F90A13D|nr:hypothetical protein OG948_34545 [Embleya sp. NBC_00888]